MSDFDDEFAESALPEMLDHLGDAVAYNDPDGSTVTALTAIVGAEIWRSVEVRGGYEEVRYRTITIGRDPASSFGGVADPLRKGTFTIDGKEWSIYECLGKTPSEITFGLIRGETEELGAKRYQKTRK